MMLQRDVRFNHRLPQSDSTAVLLPSNVPWIRPQYEEYSMTFLVYIKVFDWEIGGSFDADILLVACPFNVMKTRR